MKHSVQLTFTFLQEDDTRQVTVFTALFSMADGKADGKEEPEALEKTLPRDSGSLDKGGSLTGEGEAAEPQEEDTLKRFRARGVKLVFPPIASPKEAN